MQSGPGGLLDPWPPRLLEGTGNLLNDVVRRVINVRHQRSPSCRCFVPSQVAWFCVQGLSLIDWGRSIDITLYPEGTLFMGDCKTDSFRCPEMIEHRPWSFQVHTYSVTQPNKFLLLPAIAFRDEPMNTSQVQNHLNNWAINLLYVVPSASHGNDVEIGNIRIILQLNTALHSLNAFAVNYQLTCSTNHPKSQVHSWPLSLV